MPVDMMYACWHISPMPRSHPVTTSITLREEDWTVTASYTSSTPARPFAYGGEGDPGDPGEVEDIEITADGHAGVLEYDDLSPAERARVDEAIEVAAAEEARDAEYAAADLAHDLARDEGGLR